jgi:YD repeat-containing protein
MSDQRNAIWVVMLRPYDSGIETVAAWSLRDFARDVFKLNLRMRYNPDTRLVTLRLPAGTRHQQVFDAFDLLTGDERRRLYNLPQHAMRS